MNAPFAGKEGESAFARLDRARQELRRRLGLGIAAEGG
jgi:hypothetical protein